MPIPARSCPLPDAQVARTAPGGVGGDPAVDELNGAGGTRLRQRQVVRDQLVRAGFRMILTADGIDVVAEATNGAQAVDAVRRTRPDVVLMDVRMPKLDGLEATRRIITGAPDAPRVIMLTTFDLDHDMYAALTAGASSFLPRIPPPGVLPR